MPTIRCPACDEADDLRGERSPSGITITCQACGASWPRDTAPRCATCRGQDIRWRPQALTAFSRGTQLSILGLHNVPLCMVCDEAAFRASADSGSSLEPGYKPAAVHPRDLG